MRAAKLLQTCCAIGVGFLFTSARAEVSVNEGVRAVSHQKPTLSSAQIKTFRSWIVTIVEDQIHRGPNSRWQHRDCAGLVRYAVSEALASHDQKWRRANGFLDRPLPAELEIPNDKRELFKGWRNGESESARFVRALPLIQRNAQFLGKTVEAIEPGDLLFFDQGDEQHLMVWTGKRIVYHNGHQARAGEKTDDNGLRSSSFQGLLEWSDSRWQPRPENPNFIGFYRLSFLAASLPYAQGLQ